jgi:hypothetical protein
MDSIVERSAPEGEGIESESIDPELVAESTIPQYAPQRRSTPVATSPGPAGERSRRSTLVSPIPSLMAASMRVRSEAPDVGAAPAEGIPVLAEPQMTSKQGDRSRALLLEGESDYVVEIDHTKDDALNRADSDLTDDTNTDP